MSVKLKTHRGAAKRFKVSKGGKIKMNHAFRRHILTKKSSKHRRGLRKAGYLDETNVKVMKKLLPYA